MDDDMADIFNAVDDLVHISDEEPIDGSNFGDIFIPAQLEPVPLLTADYTFDLEWMKELTVGEPEQITSDFKNKVEEEQGTKNSSENAISSTISSVSDNSSCSGERFFLCTSGRTIPAKPRSKRSRLSFSRWASKSISPIASSVTENGSGCSTLPFSPIHAASWSQSGYFAYEQVECQSSLKFSAAKNMKKNEIKGVRKCTHCGVTKTPQWRCGPLGPRTLCNACGVRHKNGGLLPEYRPAASPTFSPGKHSNSHRKVLQIRSRKCLTGEKM